MNLELGDVPAVFRAGNVDAALIWEPGFSQLKAVPGAVVLGMDTDTEVYQRFGTMTGPDVLVLGRAWADADPYVTAGVYAEVTVKPFNKVLP